MLRSLILVCVVSLASAGAQAALVSRSGGLAYYDTDTNLTWVADANLAKTSGYDADGKMGWSQSVGWITSLNAQNAGLGYLGTNDWRLPTVTDTGTPGCESYAFTSTDCGFNVDLATGEMARMYYGTLGNTGYRDTSGVLTGCSASSPFCLTNDGPFSNLQPAYYWSGTVYALRPPNAWVFGFPNGIQDHSVEGSGFHAWAVRPGDLSAATVPVPPAVWLFGSALGLMGVMRRSITSHGLPRG